jgi:hypothetical protein
MNLVWGLPRTHLQPTLCTRPVLGRRDETIHVPLGATAMGSTVVTSSETTKVQCSFHDRSARMAKSSAKVDNHVEQTQ